MDVGVLKYGGGEWLMDVGVSKYRDDGDVVPNCRRVGDG